MDKAQFSVLSQTPAKIPFLYTIIAIDVDPLSIQFEIQMMESF